MYQFTNYKKTIKFIFIVLFYFFFSISANCIERSKKEIRIGIFLEDLNNLGQFYEINQTPPGMFLESENTFHQKQKISRKKFIDTFITKKNQMEKHTDNVILGMAYFEFYYMQQLKENKKSIETFKKKYPKINAATKNNIKKIHGLNKARETMRKSLGLSLDNTPEEAIERYFVLYKLMSQAETKKIELSLNQKNNLLNHNKISKNISQLKSLVEDKIEDRLSDKMYEKEYFKIFKKLSKNLNKSRLIKDYEILNSFVIELNNLKTSNLSVLLSGLKISEFILQNIKKNRLPKKYTQDLSNAKFNMFSQKELSILGNITKSIKINKNKKSNDLQLQIMNLENVGVPVNNFLNVYRGELNVRLDDINLQVASASNMKSWKLNDWANAWKNPIPNILVDAAGIEISLTPSEIESIKAQLAMKNFKEILNLDTFDDFINNERDSFNDIAKNLDLNKEEFNFSFTLDDFAKSFGDTYGLDINNYSDLTDLANAEHGANWSVEEYASAYQKNVDIINALQSGSINSFDAGQFAAAASASLQEVADTIRAATGAGVAVDLEATARGLGYDSFADAVDAYNREHGTNYTPEEARDALQ